MKSQVEATWELDSCPCGQLTAQLAQASKRSTFSWSFNFTFIALLHQTRRGACPLSQPVMYYCRFCTVCGQTLVQFSPSFTGKSLAAKCTLSTFSPLAIFGARRREGTHWWQREGESLGQFKWSNSISINAIGQGRWDTAWALKRPCLQSCLPRGHS